jgi:hypothetical protein
MKPRIIALSLVVLASTLLYPMQSAEAYNCAGPYASRYRGLTTDPTIQSNVRGAYAEISIRRPEHVCDVGTNAQNQPAITEAPQNVNSPALNFSLASVALSDCIVSCPPPQVDIAVRIHPLVELGHLSFRRVSLPRRMEQKSMFCVWSTS